MKRYAFFVIVLCLVSSVSFGQNTMSKASDSDPKAKKILDKLKKEYESYQSIGVDFELILDLPNQPQEVQKGWIKQNGEKFAVKISDQEIYCNGKNLWVYLISNKEVQINDYNEEDAESILSPKDMLRIYEDGEYAYAITGEEKVNGQLQTLIEFKPLDSNSEYSKMRLIVDTKNNRASSIKVFSKDGSNYTLKINKLTPNKNYSDSTFEFNSDSYPGVRVEDLRID